MSKNGFVKDPQMVFHETILGDLRNPILTLGIPNSLFVHQNRFASQFARLRKWKKNLGTCLMLKNLRSE